MASEPPKELKHTAMSRYSRVGDTIKALRDHLTRLIESGVDEETQLRAWDADSGRFEFVTGVLVKPDEGCAYICTDD